MADCYSVVIYNETSQPQTVEVYRIVHLDTSVIHIAHPDISKNPPEPDDAPPSKDAGDQDSHGSKQTFGMVTVPANSNTTFSFVVEKDTLLPAPHNPTGAPAPPYMARIISASHTGTSTGKGEDAQPKPLELDFSNGPEINLAIMFATDKWQGASGDKTVAIYQG